MATQNKKTLLSRDYLYRLSEEFAALFDELELFMIQEIIRLMDQNETNPKVIVKSLKKIMVRFNPTIKVNLKRIFENTQTATVEVILQELQRNDLLVLSGSLKQVLEGVLSTQDDVLRRTINTNYKNWLRVENKVLKNASDELATVFQDIQSLVNSGVPAAKAQQVALEKNIVQTFKYVDKAGRRWDPRTYMEMVTRTNLAKLNEETQNESLKKFGYDLVIVNVLSDSCMLCYPWEGEVLSITGKTKKYKTLKEARDAGYKHPNCRHSENLYIEGVSTIPYKQSAEETKRKGDLRDYQRYLERNIRYWKKRALVNPEKMDKVREWQKKMREFIKETGRTRQYIREKVY